MDVKRPRASTREIVARAEAGPAARDAATGGEPAAPIRRSARQSLTRPYSPRARAWVDQGVYPKPGWRDWGSLAMGIGWVFAACLMALASDPSTHVTCGFRRRRTAIPIEAGQ